MIPGPAVLSSTGFSEGVVIPTIEVPEAGLTSPILLSASSNLFVGVLAAEFSARWTRHNCDLGLFCFRLFQPFHHGMIVKGFAADWAMNLTRESGCDNFRWPTSSPRQPHPSRRRPSETEFVHERIGRYRCPAQ
jgi:hypothetical protein